MNSRFDTHSLIVTHIWKTAAHLNDFATHFWLIQIEGLWNSGTTRRFRTQIIHCFEKFWLASLLVWALKLWHASPPTPRERSITFWRPQATCSIHSDLHITHRHYYFLFDYSYLHFSSKSTKKGSITAFAKTIDDRTTQWSMRINDPELSDDPFSRNRRWMSCYCTGDDMMDREVTIGTAMLIDYGCKHN